MYYYPEDEPEVNEIINALLKRKHCLGRADLHNSIQLHASQELGIKVRTVRPRAKRKRGLLIYIRDN